MRANWSVVADGWFRLPLPDFRLRYQYIPTHELVTFRWNVKERLRDDPRFAERLEAGSLLVLPRVLSLELIYRSR
jgi:hypothetical protein